MFKRVARPTLLVFEDQVRKQFSDYGRPGHGSSKRVTVTTVLLGLRDGYDVIYEGILNFKTSGSNLQKLFVNHETESYVYYLDVSFDETVKRHQTCPERKEFSSKNMKVWWNYARPMQSDIEVIIPENSTLEETIVLINETANLGVLNKV